MEVTLAVVLSDGAGPYLLDARGRLTLVLGAHRGISRAHVTMGDAGGDQGIGLTRRRGRRPGVGVDRPRGGARRRRSSGRSTRWTN